MTFFLLYSQYLVLLFLLLLKTKVRWINSIVIISIVGIYMIFLIQVSPLLMNDKVLAHIESPFYKTHGIILIIFTVIIILMSIAQFINFLRKRF